MADNMTQVAARAAMNGKKKKKNKKYDIPDLELTEDQKKAIRAGSARAWYADLPGAFTDLAGSALDYGAEGLARLLPSDLAGYDLPESLGIRGFQRGVRNPALGSKQMEQIGEDIGYIPKTTGTKEEERARLLMGLVDPMPGISPAVAGVFASNRAKNLPELSYAKAPWQVQEKGVVPFMSQGKQDKLMRRMYDESRAREALAMTQSDIGFTSPAMKVIVGSKEESLKPKVWLNKLRGGGVPKEELEWTGLQEWLQGKGKERVTKQELQEFMQANQIQIQEVVYGDPIGTAGTPYATTKADEYMTTWAHGDESRVRIPGGQNYRELVLMVPESQFHPPVDVPSLRKKEIQIKDQMHNELNRLKRQYMSQVTPTPTSFNDDEFATWLDYDQSLMATYDDLHEQLKSVRNQIFEGKPPDARFPGEKGHYPEDNVIMHIRINERIDEDGRRVLFVEELQSDWGQKGQKQGFGKKLSPDEEARIRDRNTELKEMVDGDLRRLRDEFPEESAEYQRNVELIYQNNAGKVPSAPFVMDTNTWAGLGMKRLVRWAADNDYDAIAWTTPKQQSRRYDSQVYPKSIYYYPSMKRLETDDYTSSGRSDYRPIRIEDVEPEDLEGFIGKEAAAALLKDKTEVGDVTFHQLYQTSPGWVRKSGNKRQIELSTKGHQKFYDKLLLNQARALADEYGGTVNKTSVIKDKAHLAIEKQLRFIEEKIDAKKQSIADLEELKLPVRDQVITHNRITGSPEDIIKMEDEELAKLEAKRWELLDQRGSTPEYGDEQQWTWNLTPKLKKAAKDGLPYYVALPPIYAGTKAAQDDEYEQNLSSRAAGRAAYVQ